MNVCCCHSETFRRTLVYSIASSARYSYCQKITTTGSCRNSFMECLPLKSALCPPISNSTVAGAPRLTLRPDKASTSGSLGGQQRFGRTRGRGGLQWSPRLLVKESSASSSSVVRASKGAGGGTETMGRSVSVKEGVELKVYENTGELGADLADYIAGLSESAIKARGSFSVALSGGSLINNLGKLCAEPYAGKIDFSKWQVFWADERVVPLDHPDSNYKLAYDGLLSKVPIPPAQVHAISEGLSPQAAAGEYELALRRLVKTEKVPWAETADYPRFDLILLGMGPDGHVASLFPNHPLVHKTELWIASLEDSPKPPPERITFTLPVINSAANIAFVSAGSGKADMMKSIFGPPLPFGELPAQLVAPYKGSLVWFTDEGAVSKI